MARDSILRSQSVSHHPALATKEGSVVQIGPLIFEPGTAGPRQTKRMIILFAQAIVMNVVHLGIVMPKKSRKRVWNAITFRGG